MKILALAAALAGLSLSPARADPPPAAAPPYRAGVSLQPVVIYDAQGNIVGSLGGGSVTAPGTSGSQAQAVQGITGGVPMGISAAALPLPAGAATAASQAAELAALATIAQRAALFAEATNQSIAANSLFNGVLRDIGAAPPYTRHTAAVFASQSGTAQLIACADSGCGAGFVMDSRAVLAGSFAMLTAPIVGRYVRVAFQMGATAGVVNIAASLTAN